MSAPKEWTASPYSSVVGIAITEGDKLIAGVRGERAVAEERARLIAAAPDLLALARQYASECGECAGTRVCPDDSACIECADVWKVIDKAEGRT